MTITDTTPTTPTTPRSAATRPSTVLPARPSRNAPAPERRVIGKISRQEVLSMAGAGVSALCTTVLLFGWLTSLHGKFGFVIVFYLVFLATYALLVSLTEDRPAVIDRVMAALLTGSALLAGGALVSVIVF